MTVRNLLSFGPDTPELSLGPLNVLIGPNGSGKSNFIEALGLLRAAPRDLAAPIRETGGVGEWLHKYASRVPSGTLEAVVEYPAGRDALRYRLTIEKRQHRFRVGDECIEDDVVSPGEEQTRRHFGYRNGIGFLRSRDGGERALAQEDIDPAQSILSQWKDPHNFPQLAHLGERLRRVRIYREWSFGGHAAARQPQKSDLPNDLLAEDTSNLGLVLNRLRRAPAAKKRLLEAARKLYDGVTDFDVIVEGGTVQVFLEEDGITVPAARLSDGTLRYLCLLAILCHDDPPPLVCMEEPELGLHPDVVPTLAALLREASTRCQLVVTTHSDVLVDALTDAPESVVVCEKNEGRTQLRRLDRDDLDRWLDRYGLGELWIKGELGGTRW